MTNRTYNRTPERLVLLLCCLLLGGCQRLAVTPTQRAAYMKTDSAAFAVKSERFAYVATIGFTYVNHSGSPVSTTRCGKPGPQDLEKRVGSRWVQAYSPASLACLSTPNFVLANDDTYHSTLEFVAFEPGHGIGPALMVDSVDGTYRLRWSLVHGANPEDRSAPRIEAVSNEFRLILDKRLEMRPSSAPPPNS